MSYRWFVCCAALTLLLVCIKASRKSSEICSTGPFSFNGRTAWNTTDTGWRVVEGCLDSNYMALSVDQFEGEDRASVATVVSPPLCSPENGTYSMSFKYYIPGGVLTSTSSYLAVGILRGRNGARGDGSPLYYQRLWRSSGTNGLHFWFRTVSPSLTFRSCSSEFKLVFEGRNLGSGRRSFCGFNMVSFDDVSFSYLSDPADSPQSQLCPDDEPEPDNHNGDKRERTLTPAVIIAIIVALAVVIIVITVLVVVASTSRSRRRRRRESMAVSNETYSNVGYRTFASEASALLSRQRGSIPDYEPMDGEDSPTKPLLLPSADSEAYNRLRVTGGASAMEQNVARAHYDHVNGDTAYRDLRQQHRARDAQRQHVANDYSHI